ncbi:hypothetical protein [Hymenobacter properus]|uniref:Uncharacterized protein n=1 Tax=Hymenobacter properus TaxID=2791026 RepID=A0A931BIV0_9BACT|nr:hypothetical protein [Hymenobacter properus]MBF9142316.1 hypothetical protein [Hymenobacter properus]MBR7721123.1 hypothetical protein [Microvirga sp. SRT04]
MVLFSTSLGRFASVLGLGIALAVLPTATRAQMAPPVTAPLDVAAVDAAVARTL